MPGEKKVMIETRVNPATKRAIEEAAKREQRSVSQWVGIQLEKIVKRENDQ